MSSKLDHVPKRRSATIIPRDVVQFSEETAKVACGHEVAGATEPAEPVIETVMQDDVVVAIDVTCGCGQRIRIRCDYEQP